ncbi:MAG: polysaccharide biosynthesis C-terminal domain-containing protein, partial [Muribaculaceae bacterium]|nr:polysaccharide biosynthesis C-terminal domain-containing protein [Muribaculaceae bacterium]
MTDSIAQPKSNPNDLGTKTIGQLLVQYSLPAIVASLATSLYNIIDSIFIGRGVGSMAITGLAITFPLMNLVVAFCVLVAVGGATISSIFLGQKNVEKASMVVGNVTILCLIHSIFIVIIGLTFLDPILLFFGATDETIGYAREFMYIIILGTPISYVFLGLNNLMRATGYPRKAMVSALLSVGVNIVAAPVMIFVLDRGIAGAAMATIMGQSAAFIWVLWHFMSKKSYIHFTRECWRISGELIRRIYSIGLSPFLMNCCACLVVVFINKALLENAGADGNLAVGAYGIINRTTMCFVMIIFGITQGMQ